jgi:hypothetical protein
MIDALSIIIFMQGKAVIRENELSAWLEKEISNIIGSG